MVTQPPGEPTRYMVSCDYGTMNPTVFLLWGKCGATWYLLKEYYHDGRHSIHQRTDDQYAADLEAFVDGKTRDIIVDPSAASFITKLRQKHFRVFKADNDVLNGIRRTQSAMNLGKIKFSPGLKNLFKELTSYVWDTKAGQQGEDKVVKEHDHACDAMRYFVMRTFGKGAARIVQNNGI